MPRDEDEEDEPFVLPDAECIGESARAIRVSAPDLLDPVWLPKSVVHEDSEVWDFSEEGKGPGDLLVARWFAEKEAWA